MTRTARAKVKTRVYWLEWDARWGHWALTGPECSVGYYMSKRAAETYAREEMRQGWASDGKPRQLRIRDRKGRICAEASYGADSKRRKG